MEKCENPEYLTGQLITYIGNKRLLLGDIERQVLAIARELGRDKLICADMFSGTGAVARMLKAHSAELYANDLELYSELTNRCYLTNKKDFDTEGYCLHKERMEQKLARGEYAPGIITANYAPADDNAIRRGERAFYTHRNALIIDTLRAEAELLPERLRTAFIATLLYQASVHTNTCGVFKGFYKDSATGAGRFGGNGGYALQRILGEIAPLTPVLSSFDAECTVLRKDANALAKELPPLDIAYIDPPYNQHPYGSNYFMLNAIAENRLDAESCSRVSGIPRDWNRSRYNRRADALAALDELLGGINARYLIISYNSEGFITFSQMQALGEKHGTVRCEHIKYNTFRGSRNLSGRARYVSEYIFIIKK